MCFDNNNRSNTSVYYLCKIKTVNQMIKEVYCKITLIKNDYIKHIYLFILFLT